MAAARLSTQQVRGRRTEYIVQGCGLQAHITLCIPAPLAGGIIQGETRKRWKTPINVAEINIYVGKQFSIGSETTYTYKFK